MNNGLPDEFMIAQWEHMLDVISGAQTACGKALLLYKTSGVLCGYGIATPRPGKLFPATRMADRVRNIAERILADSGIQ